MPVTNNRRLTTGFTLLELLLYITVAAVVLMSTVFFISLIIQTRIKNQSIAEVEGQGVFILQEITQALRNGAQATVTSPTSLDVTRLDGNHDIFSLSGGQLLLARGGATIPLNSTRVFIDQLMFTNLAASGTNTAIQIGFTLKYSSQSPRNEYFYSRTFLDSITLRNH